MSRRRVDYGPPSVEKALGALPVVAAFARRLDIAGTVDRAAPVRDIAYATHGQVIEALIANLWVPKTCATWPDAPLTADRSSPRMPRRGMIFGLWA